MSNHTPGPWRFCGCGKCGILWGEVGADPKWLGCLEEGDSDGIPHVTHRSDEWEANARLVAAAPEMYELLNLAHAVIAGSLDSVPFRGGSLSKRGPLRRSHELLSRVEGSISEASGDVGAQ